jgi:hypothetical protein
MSMMLIASVHQGSIHQIHVKNLEQARTIRCRVAPEYRRAHINPDRKTALALAADWRPLDPAIEGF